MRRLILLLLLVLPVCYALTLGETGIPQRLAQVLYGDPVDAGGLVVRTRL